MPSESTPSFSYFTACWLALICYLSQSSHQDVPGFVLHFGMTYFDAGRIINSVHIISSVVVFLHGVRGKHTGRCAHCSFTLLSPEEKEHRLRAVRNNTTPPYTLPSNSQLPSTDSFINTMMLYSFNTGALSTYVSLFTPRCLESLQPL